MILVGRREMHTIIKNNEQVLIQIQNPKDKMLDSINECKEGRCGCKTDEYKKIDKMEISENKETISITLTPKAGEDINTSEIEKCINYTSNL